MYTNMCKGEAEALGFAVDTSCYPWVAYKGTRFQPDEMKCILTDREYQLALLAKEAKATDDKMNDAEVAPTGDDYNGLFCDVRHRSILAGVWHEQG